MPCRCRVAESLRLEPKLDEAPSGAGNGSDDVDAEASSCPMHQCSRSAEGGVGVLAGCGRCFWEVSDARAGIAARLRSYSWQAGPLLVTSRPQALPCKSWGGHQRTVLSGPATSGGDLTFVHPPAVIIQSNNP